MKKIVIIFLMMFFLTGCGSKEEISEAAVKFVDINDKLVYDSFTHVVYIENYTYILLVFVCIALPAVAKQQFVVCFPDFMR